MEIVRSIDDQTIPASERTGRRETARAIIQRHNSSLYETRTFIDKHTEAELLILMQGQDVYERKAAMDNIALDTLKQNMPLFIQVMTTDPSLLVREAAFRRFAQIRNDPDPKHQVENLINSQALKWWTEHQAEYTSKGKK